MRWEIGQDDLSNQPGKLPKLVVWTGFQNEFPIGYDLPNVIVVLERVSGHQHG